MDATIGISILLAHVLANAGVSVAVARSHYYSTPQKVFQAMVVWLLPVVGVIGVGVFLYSQRDKGMFDTRQYPVHREESSAEFVLPGRGGHSDP